MDPYCNCTVHTLGFGAMKAYLDNSGDGYTLQRDRTYVLTNNGLTFFL